MGEELTAAECEEWRERAAIMQFEAGMSREMAEREAMVRMLAKRPKQLELTSWSSEP